MNTAHKYPSAEASARDLDSAPSPDRLLTCMAGFYRHEAQARAALRQVQRAQGPAPAQSMLLLPEDASRLRFARMSRTWASDDGGERSRRVSGRWVVGAALAIVAALALLGKERLGFDTWQLGVLFAALGLVGLLGAGLLALGAQRPRPAHRFDEQVRRQLGLGYCALVAHRVAWAEQAEVVVLLRSSSQRWCATAPHSQRL